MDYVHKLKGRKVSHETYYKCLFANVLVSEKHPFNVACNKESLYPTTCK